MRQILILLCIGFIFTNEVTAKKLKILGTYIDSNNDTIDCKFKIPMYKTKNGDYKIDLVGIQYKIKAIRIEDNVKVKLTPKTIKGYEFGYEYRHFIFKSVNVASSEDRRNIFLQNIVDGKIKMYLCYKEIVIPLSSSNGQNGGGNVNMTLDFKYNRYYIQKDSGQVYELNKKFYKTKLVELISDCSRVKNLYSLDEYDKEHIYSIVIDYNTCED